MIHSIFNLDLDSPTPEGHKEIILGAGCFWGVERRLWNLQGVRLTSAGYAGGTSVNPSYEEVCSGSTGHAEVVKVVFDPLKISLRSVERIFDFLKKLVQRHQWKKLRRACYLTP